MTKTEFLAALRGRLSQLPNDELDKQLSYYSELIDDMSEEGMGEETAVAKLGDVNVVAEAILREAPLSVLVRSRVRPGGGWTAASVLLVALGSPLWLSLLAALLAAALSVYIALWSVIIALFSVVLAVALCAVALPVAAAFNLVSAPREALMVLGGGLVCAGLSVFAWYGALAVARAVIRLTARVAVGAKGLFIRKEVVA